MSPSHPATCVGLSSLPRGAEAGSKRWLMQANEVLYLHPQRVRLEGPAIDVDADPLPVEAIFEAVGEEVFRNYGRHWKPRTLKVNRGYLRNRILPWFRGRNVADITRADVQRWFASLHATPGAARPLRPHPLLHHAPG